MKLILLTERALNNISYHFTLHHITSYHITSQYITSHHITSHHITLHHNTSHHITSHHIHFQHPISNLPLPHITFERMYGTVRYVQVILQTMRALPRSIRMLSPIVDFVVTFENEEVMDGWMNGWLSFD